MRISDWSSDVCSSDLRRPPRSASQSCSRNVRAKLSGPPETAAATAGRGSKGASAAMADRKSVVEGKSVSVRVDLGGRRIFKKKTTNSTNTYHHYSYACT